jgi:hypothetical protein
MMRADFSELCNEYGLREAKSAQPKAALEIGRRLGMMQPDEKYQIKARRLQVSINVHSVLESGFHVRYRS